MSSSAQSITLELLSENLLRLGRAARDVPTPDFFSHAVGVIRESIGFSCGWWGVATDQGEGKLPAIHQAEYMNLPNDFAAEWRKISLFDSFAVGMRDYLGQVHRYTPSGADDLPPEIVEFDRRYDICSLMGAAFDEASTGYIFFIVLYRGARDSPFNDDEAVLFLHLLRHAVQLWHHRLQDALAAASKEDIARAALVRSDGRVVYAGPELCELLYAQWPLWDGITLPADVIAQFAQAPCNLRLGSGVIDISARGEDIWLVRTSPETATRRLSPRERRVAHLFAAGQSYKEIAQLLALTPSTVRTYIRDVYLRLGVKNKVQLGDALHGAATR